MNASDGYSAEEKMTEKENVEAPACLGPEPRPNPVSFTMPKGAWDTHFHVFGPTNRFPYARKRKYTPPDAPLENYLRLMEELGIERGVCVHPNLHGSDNSVTFDAVERSDGRFLAIVKVDREITLAELREMKRKGTCGVRFAFNPEHGSGELDTELFDRVVAWCEDLDLCVNLHFAAEALKGLAESLSRLRLPTIIDHFARIDTCKGVDQPEFTMLLDLMKLPHIWMKATGADRITKVGAPYEDVLPFAQALVKTAPDRIIWGTDWPHSGIFDRRRMPNDGDLANFLSVFAPTDELRQKILVDNPQRLFQQS
ncbi:putative TIM-barrel fold metal-dependent hydrolase [Aminobacter lissarensis]|uniref:TIM-barrel fold metal-dependent hydrolase n=1 Tax=Aminobacter carboxidus TaxID=376165 RepID=A0A8E2BEI5_9HYPH|nr:4-sulfomuconolactone hydrolase [Aminobacter lissarensis]MBB6469103.1 putative TIM-barrel fold metal-dependent hydrolase [Aminobacter lissarensis]